MGEESEDSAPTGVAPTELGEVVETKAVTAWSLDDGEEWEPPRRITPGRITAAAVAGALLLIAVASALAAYHLRSESAAPLATPVPLTSVILTTAAPPTPTPTVQTTHKGWGIPDELVPPPTKTVTVERSAQQMPADMLAALDRRFISSLEAQGWVIWDPATATRRAHQVCVEFQQHSSMNQIMERLAAEAIAQGEPNAVVMAEQFAYTALETYPDCERR